MIFEVVFKLLFVAYGLTVAVTLVAMLICIVGGWRKIGLQRGPNEDFGTRQAAFMSDFSRKNRWGNIAQIGFTTAFCLFPLLAILAALRPDLPISEVGK